MKIEIRKGPLYYYVVIIEKEWFRSANTLKECFEVINRIIEQYNSLSATSYMQVVNSLDDVVKYTEIILVIDENTDMEQQRKDFIEYLI